MICQLRRRACRRALVALLGFATAIAATTAPATAELRPATGDDDGYFLTFRLRYDVWDLDDLSFHDVSMGAARSDIIVGPDEQFFVGKADLCSDGEARSITELSGRVVDSTVYVSTVMALYDNCDAPQPSTHHRESVTFELVEEAETVRLIEASLDDEVRARVEITLGWEPVDLATSTAEVVEVLVAAAARDDELLDGDDYARGAIWGRATIIEGRSNGIVWMDLCAGEEVRGRFGVSVNNEDQEREPELHSGASVKESFTCKLPTTDVSADFTDPTMPFQSVYRPFSLSMPGAPHDRISGEMTAVRYEMTGELPGALYLNGKVIPPPGY